MSSLDVQALRAHQFAWAVRKEAVYLNAASTGPLPKRSVETLRDFNALRATPHRLSEALQFGPLVRCRSLLATMLGVTPAEIALAPNTGYGINVAAAALPLEPGEVIVVPDGEFPANVYPWMQHAKRRGATVRLVPRTPEGLMDEDALLAAIEAPGVRILAVSWVGYTTGFVADLARLGEACRRRGVWFVVDAIQGLGARTLDLSAVHVDVLACGAQKWLLSPWGTGFTYVRGELARTMEPPWVSWLAVQGSADFNRLLDYDLTWHDDARRFEPLTIAFQDFAAMAESLELFAELGPAAVEEHVASLSGDIVAFAQERGIPLATPADPARRAGIVSLRFPDAEAERVSAALTAKQVIHSLREGLIRLSPHLYNTRDEVGQALKVLDAERASS